MENWTDFLNELLSAALNILILVLLIGTVWRFFKERNYPWYYRVFDYLGCLLLFTGPFWVIIIGKWLEIHGAIIAGLVAMALGVGCVCIGISFKILPEEYNKDDRKRGWKTCIAIGSFITLYSILFVLHVAWR